ncbi:MAG TPA: hypothetical protein VNA04_00670 [Thermoanaerobaculia bacterium]|nr:hypothetical protein [Thermoanaerobaculia bacterium]
MKGATLILAALSLSALWQQATRETSSGAAASRGARAYERQQYGQAAAEFAAAAAIEAAPRNLFNLGTAQIAAGQRTEGSATLAGAMADPALRAQALFNRGNSALAANAFEHAVRDYTDALKITPADRDAKRNLEIALHRQQAAQQRRQSGGESQQQQGAAPQPDPAPEPAPASGGEEKGEADAEALLRSVQQQEQEELGRMKRSRGDSRRVGW